ncbi:hypothetical protein ACFFTN_04330 [Aminobacter aganoensis]|uniref:Uncharacterized membrane protein HdeD (DUF308 family) n=1 Tax=Aminobacter aganoensis TaxID=83264 RepID=A0A7X0F780_9HYPH|nr:MULTISPECIES: hypothetical protein [Aminobacter]MBB6354218.1 uncharacterized membrane protein HdeD (DUF308 family) [Aminobacter aganoensis]
MTPTPQSQSPDPKNLWKEQDMQPQTMTPQMLESRSLEFEDRIRTRNKREYVIGSIVAVVTVAFGTWMLLSVAAAPSSLMTGIGFILLGLGAAAAIFQLRRRAGGQAFIDGSSNTSAAYRAELVRQRDALRSIFSWYVAPFLPGLLLIYGAGFFEPDGIEWGTLIPGFLTVAFGIWLVRANHKAADGLDQEIKGLDARG